MKNISVAVCVEMHRSLNPFHNCIHFMLIVVTVVFAYVIVLIVFRFWNGDLRNLLCGIDSRKNSANSVHPFRSSNVSFFTLQNRAWSLMHTWRATGVRPASRSLGIKQLVMWTLTWSSYCLLIQLCRRKPCLQTPHKLSLTI